MVRVILSPRHRTQYHFNMIGPWIFIPPFMGLLEDNYEDSISTEILQDKNNGKTKAEDKSVGDSSERDS